MSNLRDTPGTYWITGCAHAPWHNKRMYDSVFKFLSQEVRLQGIILAGDIADMNSLSSHDRGKTPLPGVTLDWEYKQTSKFLDEIDSLKSKTTDYLYGNHEDRYLRAMKDVDTSKLGDALKSPIEGLQLEKRRYNIYTDWKNDSIKLGRHLDICHGEFLNVHSAKKTIDTYRKSTLYFHCFSETTEILTKDGWKRGLDLTPDDIVATMNKTSRLLEWNKINGKYVYDNYKELYSIKSSNIDISVTDQHGLIFDKNGKLVEKTAKELYDNPELNAKFILALNEVKPDYPISDLDLRFIVQIVTDGSYTNKRGVSRGLQFHYRKQRKIDVLKSLLNDLGIEHTQKITSSGTTHFYITVANAKKYIDLIGPVKRLPDYIRHLSKRQCKILLDEYVITDGNLNETAPNVYQVYTAKKEETDILQELFVRNGYRSSVIKRPCGTYNIAVNSRDTTELKTTDHISITPYSGKVWCVNVDNGTLVIRNNGKTVITLNTHRFQIYMEGLVAGWNMGAGADFKSPVFGYATRAMKSSWVNASCIVTLDKEGFYHVEPLIYINDKLIVNGKKF